MAYQTGTIGDWPHHPNAAKKALPAHIHEVAVKAKLVRNLRLMDPDAAQHGPVRWLVKDGKPVAKEPPCR